MRTLTNRQPTKQQLEECYVEQRMSVRECARHFDIPLTTIFTLLVKHGIPRRSHKVACRISSKVKIKYTDVYDLYYRHGYTQQEVADELGVSQRGIGKILSRSGLPVRRYTRRSDKRRAN